MGLGNVPWSDARRQTVHVSLAFVMTSPSLNGFAVTTGPKISSLHHFHLFFCVDHTVDLPK